MDDIERCAQVLGMRRREVLEVVPVDGGQLVRTHDFTWTLIRDDGTIVHRADPPADGVTPDALEDVVDVAEEIAKDAAPRRGRGRGRA